MARLKFEDHYETFVREINKRRLSWTLASVSFDDVRQIILAHINEKLHQFDPTKGELTHWAQSLISSQIYNILRKNLGKWSRPCVAGPGQPKGCPFNTGNEMCSQTPSGLQCNECLIYRDWEKRKSGQFNVQQTLPLENHRQEVSNIGADFTDVAKCKEVIDREIKKLLTKYEWKMYRMLYIQGLEPAKVGKALGYRKSGRLHHGYLQVLRFRHKVVALSKTIIAEHNLV